MVAGWTKTRRFQRVEIPSSHSVIHDVELALATGNFRGAIEFLARANRLNPSPELERLIMEVRINGFQDLSPPLVEWNAAHDNQFAGTAPFPEIRANELDDDVLRAGVLGKGGLIVRGLMEHDVVSRMREYIQLALTARRNMTTGRPGPADGDWFHRVRPVAGGPVQFDRLGSNRYTETGSLWTVDSPRSAFALVEFYHGTGLVKILREYFGEEAVLSVRKWVLRCMLPNNSGVSGWHQDGRFIGENIRSVNCWIALSECGKGTDSPGIEFVAGTERKIYETGTRGAVFDWTVGQDLVDDISGGKTPVQPRFAPGDAIFFDHYSLHRTAFGTDHGSPRYAIESWFFAASKAPAKQQPLLL